MDIKNIFGLEASKRDSDCVKQIVGLEIDALADFLETAKDIPYVGALVKLGKVGISFRDWQFTRRLARFLIEADDIEEQKKIAFYSSLSEKDNERISSYLLNLLNAAEEDDKAVLIGQIYRARLMGEIDNDQMLRLCSIVTRAFVADLQKLPDYLEENKNVTLEAQSFINLGLIDNFLGGYWKGDESCSLNDTGILLHKIMEKSGWFDNIVIESSGDDVLNENLNKVQ